MAEYVTTDGKHVKPKIIRNTSIGTIVSPPPVINGDTMGAYIPYNIYKEEFKKKHKKSTKKFWNIYGTEDGRYLIWNKDKENTLQDIPDDVYNSIMEAWGIPINQVNTKETLNYLNYIE